MLGIISQANADSDPRRSFRSNASTARQSAATSTARRPSKMVRICSIDNPTTHLRDQKTYDAAAGASHRVSEHRSSTVDQLALLYAMGLTLFGFVFPLSNYVSIKPFAPWLLATFYILLYLVSIAFLVFFLFWILRRPAYILFLPPDEQEALAEMRRKGPVVFQVGRRDSPTSYDDNEGEDNGACSDVLEPMSSEQAAAAVAAAAPSLAADGVAQIELHEPEHSGNADSAGSISDVSSTHSSFFDTQGTQNSVFSEPGTSRRRRGLGERINSTLLQNAMELGVQEIPAYSVLSLQESHSPSFFLRVACFIFGALKITHESLMIVDTLTDVSGGCAAGSEPASLVLQYTLSICFTVLQTFLIFKYSKVSVNVFRNLTILGFMHLLATNMCIWFQAILLETSHNTFKYAAKNTSSYISKNDNGTATTSSSSGTARGCSKDVFWRMAPYLFPFTIEYALMAAFSCFSLYRNVSKFLDVIQSKGFNMAKNCLRNRKRSQTSFSASCYKTDKGFFLGALLLILGLVSGIYFTVYVNDNPHDNVTSQMIYQITDLVLLTANLLLCIAAYYQLRQLTILHKVGTGPDSWLLGITLIGVLAFQLFLLFGSSAEVGSFLGLRLAQGIVCILQSVFQVYLVLDGEKRRSKSEEAIRDKPGREMIAAVLLGNIALWLVYTLEIREINNLPNYSAAYLSVASNIFTYVCSPLIIFFRFHSACCFVEIWRNAYKSKKKRCASHPDLTVCSTLPGSIEGLAVANEKTHV